ncbi:hypothetical protein TYRP_011675 [Tyrophagus putrescentiae]|nr:hypothetical protein TYRP_018675 [Tyrophagus putrescentiae]KAH9408022.1 hypothetical protein TYRP_011675 [Tyrophagus putrescentiae]
MILLIGHQGEQVPGSSVGPIAQHRKGKMRHEDDHDLLSDKGCQKELHHQVGGPKEEDDKNVGADRYIDEKVVEEEAAKGAVQRKKDLKILDVVAGLCVVEQQVQQPEQSPVKSEVEYSVVEERLHGHQNDDEVIGPKVQREVDNVHVDYVVLCDQQQWTAI